MHEPLVDLERSNTRRQAKEVTMDPVPTNAGNCVAATMEVEDTCGR